MLALVNGQNIKILTADSYECLGILDRHTRSVYCLDFSPVGRFLVSGGTDKRAILWDIEHLEHVMDFEHEESVWKIHFCNFGDYFLTNDTLGCIRKWDTSTGNNTLSICTCFDGDVECLLLPDCSKIISCGQLALAHSQQNLVGFWDCESGTLCSSIPCNTPTSLALSPAGDALAVGFDDGKLAIYQIIDGTPSEDSVVMHLMPESSARRSIYCVIYSLDGTKMACKMYEFRSDRRVAQLIVWEICSGQEFQELLKIDVGLDDHEVSFSPEGDCILTTKTDHAFQVIDIHSGESRFTSTGSEVGVFSRPVSVVLM